MSIRIIFLIILFFLFVSFEGSSPTIQEKYFIYSSENFKKKSIEDITNWKFTLSSQTCPIGKTKPCIIQVASPYYHQRGDIFVLNDEAYSTDPDREEGDLRMIINTSKSADDNMYNITGGTIVPNSIVNRD